MFKGSWKTTISGVGAIAAAVAGAASLITTGDFAPEKWSAVVTGLATGLGLLFARDNNVSSEDAGAK